MRRMIFSRGHQVQKLTVNEGTDKRLLLRLGVSMLVALFLSKIFISNQLATSGTMLRELEKSIAEIENTNQKLYQEITKKTSLGYLSKKALDLNLYAQPQMVKLIGPATLASREANY